MLGITGLMGDIAGAGSDDELYGRKVVVPDYPELDDAQEEATRFNTNRLPDITELGSKVNAFNQDELERMLRHAIPNLTEINEGVGDSLASMVRGQLPKDVADLIERKSAEKAVGGGFTGSGMHRNMSARDLGLTSLELTQRGISSAERWISSARQSQTAPLYDVTSMFVSPAQQFAAKEGKYQRDLYAAQMEAAPDPGKRGAWDSEMSFLGMVLSAYSGGAGYTGQYRGVGSGYEGQDDYSPRRSGGGGGSYVPMGGGGNNEFSNYGGGAGAGWAGGIF